MWNTVECPYCEKENDMSDALSDGLSSDNKFDTECSFCEEEFEVEVEFDPQYSASKIVYEDCDICGQSTRDPAKRGKIFPYPESIKEDIVCTTCFFKGHRADYDKTNQQYE